MKSLSLRICNACLYLATCLLAGTGLLLELRLDGEDGRRVLWMGRDDWGELHLVIALVFVGLSAAHLAMNWKWVSGLLRSGLRWPVLATVVAGLALVVGLLVAPSGGGHAGPAAPHDVRADED